MRANERVFGSRGWRNGLETQSCRSEVPAIPRQSTPSRTSASMILHFPNRTCGDMILMYGCICRSSQVVQSQDLPAQDQYDILKFRTPCQTLLPVSVAFIHIIIIQWSKWALCHDFGESNIRIDIRTPGRSTSHHQ